MWRTRESSRCESLRLDVEFEPETVKRDAIAKWLIDNEPSLMPHESLAEDGYGDLIST